jgi:7-carboxy-7-deazaguanine synthase (Cx14CxxC type)
VSYQVKEIFLSIQGEGARTGRPAVFLRFSGCNLWTGREQDRASAVCKFCDTNFVGTDGAGGGSFLEAHDLARAVADKWPLRSSESPYVVCTGGEPLLQLDAPLIEALHGRGFEIAIETNGTLPIPRGIDWSCVSPKADAEFVAQSGNELKLIYPQRGAEPERYEGLSFANFFLQPMDGPELRQNMAAAVEYCIGHPQWRLSLQTHKLLGIP